MNIGIDARAIGVYPGLGRYAKCLINAMLELNTAHHFTIFTCSDRMEYGWEEVAVNKPNAREIQVDVPLLSPRNFLNLNREFMVKDLDLFHALFQVAPNVSGVPVVLTVHDTMDLDYPYAYSHHPIWKQVLLRSYFHVGMRLSLYRARKIVAVSKATMYDLLSLFPKYYEKYRVVYEAPEDCFKNRATEDDIRDIKQRFTFNNNYILYVGNTKHYKNLANLILGYEHYRQSGGEPVLLVLVGMKQVDDPKFINVLNSCKYGDSILLPGSISDSELRALYGGALFTCLVSEREGFGLTALESMACGTPVLASNRSAVREITKDAAFHVDPFDPTEIADGIKHLVESASLRCNLAERGRMRASQFSWRKAAKEMLKIYDGM